MLYPDDNGREGTPIVSLTPAIMATATTTAVDSLQGYQLEAIQVVRPRENCSVSPNGVSKTKVSVR